PESGVVFDYAEPFENYPDDRRADVMAIAARAASRGEPWLSLFDPAELSKMLRNKGFGIVEDLGMAGIAERFYGALKQGIVIGPGAHIVRAQKARSWVTFPISPNSPKPRRRRCELVHKHHRRAELHLPNRPPFRGRALEVANDR